jgi:tetratricopeptide (TPR) repeat protein
MKFKKEWRWFVYLLAAGLFIGVVGRLLWSQHRTSSVAACYKRADDFEKEGKFGLALRELDEAMGLGANKADYLARRAFFEYKWGRLYSAEDNYQTSITINPDNADAWANQADIYYRLDDMHAALQAATESLKHNPRHVVALTNRARVALYMHAFKDAADDATKALEYLGSAELPLKRSILVLRAQALQQLSKGVQSKQDLLAARTLVPVVHSHVELAKSLESEFSQKVVRPRFVLCTNITAGDTAKVADFFDRFLSYVDKKVCPVKSDPTFHIFLFSDSNEYEECLNRIGDTTGPMSHYSSDCNALFTYAKSKKGIYARALMHKVLEEMPFLDAWAKNGIPALFETFYGYPSDDNYNLVLGLDSPSRVKANVDDVTGVSLPEAIGKQNTSVTETPEKLAAIYLYRSGKLVPYLKLCQSGLTGCYATVFETVLGDSAIRLEAAWKKYLVEIKREEPEIRILPASEIFDDKQEFDKFAKTVPPQLSWPFLHCR